MTVLRYLVLSSLLLSLSVANGNPVTTEDISVSGAMEPDEAKLSERAIANHFVWASGEMKDIKPEWIQSDLIGGILLDHPEENADLPPHISIALQIDEALQITTQEVSHINLKTLLAIEDENLRRDYLKWFEDKARSYGYDHLILPNRETTKAEFASLYKQMHALNADFFLPAEALNNTLDIKRKKFYDDDSLHLAKVIDATNFELFEKTLRKGPKKDQNTATDVQKHIQSLLRPNPAKQLSSSEEKSMFTNIWAQSIIPIQRQQDVLPLKSDTVAIWTSSLTFAAQMDLYFNTIQNIRFDEISINTPVVIDGRQNPMVALEKALEYAAHPIIWIGDLNLLPGLLPQAMLYTTGDFEALDHILPEMLYGSEPIIGSFKEAIPSYLTSYSFSKVSRQQLLGFSSPEWLEMDAALLDSIDWLADEMIHEYAAPGAQVLVAKEGKIVLQKSYGHLTYDSLMPVYNHTLYDLASLTKVTATLLATMKLNQEKKLLLDSTISYYLPGYKNTNKAKITIRQLLAHQSGLKSYMPFWKRSLNGDFVDIFYYKSQADAENDKRSYGYQPDPVMLDSMISWIQGSPLIAEENAPYKYSDIGFMILHQVIESITSQSIDDYLNQTFYQPLGMYATCFNPLNKGVELFDIAPTEYDYYFRDEQVWGQVHDRNAAVFGGVAGHAGLFSNAKDLALLLQMLLQDGLYRDQQFISPHTLGKFNTQYFANNRRGLGWDKPGKYNPNISPLANENSFGHTGFTGTMVWVDPAEELIFIFLSNRIFPDSNNKNLIKLDTRRRMHDLVYRSLRNHQRH
jgi:CubicO group peptidase (beta-lactamase class C family)